MIRRRVVLTKERLIWALLFIAFVVFSGSEDTSPQDQCGTDTECGCGLGCLDEGPVKLKVNA